MNEITNESLHEDLMLKNIFRFRDNLVGSEGNVGREYWPTAECSRQPKRASTCIRPRTRRRAYIFPSKIDWGVQDPIKRSRTSLSHPTNETLMTFLSFFFSRISFRRVISGFFEVSFAFLSHPHTQIYIIYVYIFFHQYIFVPVGYSDFPLL